MRVSREQVAENRRTILAAAARLFRDRGIEAVTVAEVMKEAGLTHGAFYGYFPSKTDLARDAVAFAARPQAGDDAPRSLAGFAERYLTRRHRDDRAAGCAFAALAGEAVRQTPEIRHELSEALRAMIERLEALAPRASPDQRRKSAVAACSTMVGGLLLARLSDDPDLSDEILDASLGAVSDAPPRRPGTACRSAEPA